MEQDHPNDNADIEQPKAKKAKRECHFGKDWPKEFPGIGRSKQGMPIPLIRIPN